MFVEVFLVRRLNMKFEMLNVSKPFITFFTFVELYFDEMIEYGV